jgi:Flp pilus assembly protein TadB
MFLAVLLAGGILVGVPFVIVAGVLLFSLLPAPVALVGVLVIIVASTLAHKRTRAASAGGEGDLLRQISGRVSAGATIRSTIADPTIDVVPEHARRLAALGVPMAAVAEALIAVFPVNGRSFRAICSFSEHTGAGISAALSVLADRADDASELARERRVALAQVKLSAVVVGLVPIAASIGLVALRGVPDPGGAIIVVPMVAGIALQVVGTAVVFTVASRAT